MESRIAEVKEKEELSNLRPPVSGDDIMKLFNLKPGPSVGIIMKALYEQRLNEGEVTKEDCHFVQHSWIRRKCSNRV